MRILVTGAGGMVGGELARRWAAAHDVVAGVHRTAAPPGLPSLAFDLLDAGRVARLVEEARPEAVVHCAAWADPDACERDPQGARRANVEAVGVLARACRRAGLPLVSFSTDLVFSGERAFSDELAEPAPLLAYGRTKQEGEQVALAEHPDAVVARLALVTGRGHGRPTASESIAWALREGRAVQLFTDQFRTPVDVAAVAEGVMRMLERGARGLFHLGGPERVSRHELGLRVARALSLPAALVQGARQGDRPGAPRPADVSLDITRARRELGWEPTPLEASIREGR